MESMTIFNMKLYPRRGPNKIINVPLIARIIPIKSHLSGQDFSTVMAQIIDMAI